MSKKIENIENIEASRSQFPYHKGLKYIGRGLSVTRSNLISKKPISFRNCVFLCEQNRVDVENKPEVMFGIWNGLAYKASDEKCYCIKGDSGHNDHEEWAHFRFE